MGSLGSAQEELTVLVTGFGPFKEGCPVNPSGEIAASLPDYLPPDPTPSPSSSSSPPPPNLPPVRILKLPAPVRVSWEAIREHVVPALWDGEGDGGGRVDYAVHVGMSGPELVYSLERRAHRDGYDGRPDVDGVLLGDGERRAAEGEAWVWSGMPEELVSGFDVEDVHRRCVGRGPKNLYLQISDDAGHYACDFIYFSSLAHLRKRQRPGKVIFLHVPQHADDESLELGRELVLTLVRSLVESEVQREREGEEKGKKKELVSPAVVG